MSRLPLIIGRDNPLSVEPRHALYPYPKGCSGWRLWQMLQERVPDATAGRYVRTFDRVNLVVGQWRPEIGEETAARLISSGTLLDRVVLLLGQDVRRAFGLDDRLVHPVRHSDTVFRQVPHPSGRNRWYNDPVNSLIVGMVLEEMYCESAQRS